MTVSAALLLCLLPLTGYPEHKSAARVRAKQYGFRVLHTYPHNPLFFTQGFEFRAGMLYEGTGLPGRSAVRKENLQTGEVLQAAELAPEFFGEGITVMNGRVFELTWQSHVAFVYDQATLRQIRTFTYAGEGWGLANDGNVLYMSDGTSEIRVLDPTSFAERRRIPVHDGNRPITMLNELECVRGEIYANIWHSDRIARIAPQDGAVTGWIDLSRLVPKPIPQDPEAVLNGIAYDAMGDRLFVTGKLWPSIFEIKVIPK
jgi:glutamine cyclotransferase